MTAILSGGVQSFLPLHDIDQMSEGVSDVWRRQQYPQMSLPAVNNYWTESHHATAMNGMTDMDLRFHAAEKSADYESTFHHDAGSLISQPMGYVPDANWGSDMDIGTPSTAGFPSDPLDGYHHMRHTSNPNHHLNLAQRHEHNPSVQSPQSSHDSGISPHQAYANAPDAVIKEERPNLTRSITAPAAPEVRQRRGVVMACTTSAIKRSGSEDEDDEYIPNEEAKPRGRKRQRIPHTAVERRYRENLNAHLDKLRQTVPSLASKRPAGNSKLDGIGEGVKPSKCEILNGAIEHIGALGKENSALKTEVNALRSRLEDLERWYGASAQFGK